MKEAHAAPILPNALQPKLDALLAELDALVPAKLRCAALYGGLAKGKAHTSTSDVNLLLVTEGPPLESLKALAAPLARARRSVGVSPLVASPADLEAMARHFPLKYEDIRRHHRVLLGRDPFGGKAADAKALERDALANLANLSLRLKRAFVERAGDPGLQLDALEDLLSSSILVFKAALDPADVATVLRREDVLAKAAAKAGVPAEPLLALLAVKKGSAPAEDADVAALHGALLAAVEGVRAALEPR